MMRFLISTEKKIIHLLCLYADYCWYCGTWAASLPSCLCSTLVCVSDLCWIFNQDKSILSWIHTLFFCLCSLFIVLICLNEPPNSHCHESYWALSHQRQHFCTSSPAAWKCFRFIPPLFRESRLNGSSSVLRLVELRNGTARLNGSSAFGVMGVQRWWLVNNNLVITTNNDEQNKTKHRCRLCEGKLFKMK